VPIYPDGKALWRACWRGTEPAESLPADDRDRLLSVLAATGWSVPRIAAHCRMTEYTTRRILTRLWLREWDETATAALEAALSTTSSTRKDAA